MGGIKRTAADAHFSNAVRSRDRWTCQRCRKNYEHATQGLDCAHIVGRRGASTRYDLQNALSLCFTCHRWFDGEILEAGDWFCKTFGDDRKHYLLERKNWVVKNNDKLRNSVSAHYRQELKSLGDDPTYTIVNFDILPFKK